MHARRSLNGATAGGIAAAVWAAQQPFDKRAFASAYDDVELLGKLVTREASWPLAGLVTHLANGALFGAAYAQLKPFIPGPPLVRAIACGLAEHVALWPLGRLSDRYHPARHELAPLGTRRAFAQATWRHLLFGAVLGAVEHRLNRQRHEEPPPVPASSNGHGDIESAAVAAA